jgi:transcriptional regulator GlxA family with amidase domain
MRPSYLANFLKIQNPSIREWVGRMDQRVRERHSREEIADIARPVIAC